MKLLLDMNNEKLMIGQEDERVMISDLFFWFYTFWLESIGLDCFNCEQQGVQVSKDGFIKIIKNEY